MTGILKTKLIRIYEPSEPLTGSAGQILTSRRFLLKNGVFMQSHIFEPITMASLWDLPMPGQVVRRKEED